MLNSLDLGKDMRYFNSLLSIVVWFIVFTGLVFAEPPVAIGTMSYTGSSLMEIYVDASESGPKGEIDYLWTSSAGHRIEAKTGKMLFETPGDFEVTLTITKSGGDLNTSITSLVSIGKKDVPDDVTDKHNICSIGLIVEGTTYDDEVVELDKAKDKSLQVILEATCDKEKMDASKVSEVRWAILPLGGEVETPHPRGVNPVIRFVDRSSTSYFIHLLDGNGNRISPIKTVTVNVLCAGLVGYKAVEYNGKMLEEIVVVYDRDKMKTVLFSEGQVVETPLKFETCDPSVHVRNVNDEKIEWVSVDTNSWTDHDSGKEYKCENFLPVININSQGVEINGYQSIEGESCFHEFVIKYTTKENNKVQILSEPIEIEIPMLPTAIISPGSMDSFFPPEIKTFSGSESHTSSDSSVEKYDWTVSYQDGEIVCEGKIDDVHDDELKMWFNELGNYSIQLVVTDSYGQKSKLAKVPFSVKGILSLMFYNNKDKQNSCNQAKFNDDRTEAIYNTSEDLIVKLIVNFTETLRECEDSADLWIEIRDQFDNHVGYVGERSTKTEIQWGEHYENITKGYEEKKLFYFIEEDFLKSITGKWKIIMFLTKTDDKNSRCYFGHTPVGKLYGVDISLP